MSLKEKLKGEPVKEKGDVFVLHPNSICNLSREPSPEENFEENQDRIRGGRCVRCDKKVEEEMEFCKNCGQKIYITE